MSRNRITHNLLHLVFLAGGGVHKAQSLISFNLGYNLLVY